MSLKSKAMTVSSIVVTAVLIGSPMVALAVNVQMPFETTFPDEEGPANADDLQLLINKVFNWIMGIIVALSIIFLLYAGVLYFTAGGDPEKVSAAKNQLIYAVVGIAIIILANTVYQLVGSFI